MNDSQVEQLAAELIALPLAELSAAETDRRITAIIGDADRDVARAALDRAAKVMQERTAAAMRYAEMLAAIERLANATGCPDDADAAQWLLGLGLIEPDGPCGYRLTAAATLRAV
jgi:hypothetical protein